MPVKGYRLINVINTVGVVIFTVYSFIFGVCGAFYLFKINYIKAVCMLSWCIMGNTRYGQRYWATYMLHSHELLSHVNLCCKGPSATMLAFKLAHSDSAILMTKSAIIFRTKCKIKSQKLLKKPYTGKCGESQLFIELLV